MPVVTLATITRRPHMYPWVAQQVDQQRAALEAQGHEVRWLLLDNTPFGDVLKTVRAAGEVHRAPDDAAHHPDLSVGELRNAAMDRARGWLRWIDDDDWYHPQSTVWLLGAAETERKDWAAWATYYVGHARLGTFSVGFRSSAQPVNGAAIYHIDRVRDVRYDGAKKPASDVRWLKRLQLAKPMSGRILKDRRPHALIALHSTNTGNRSRSAREGARHTLAWYAKQCYPLDPTGDLEHLARLLDDRAG